MTTEEQFRKGAASPQKLATLKAHIELSIEFDQKTYQLFADVPAEVGCQVPSDAVLLHSLEDIALLDERVIELERRAHLILFEAQDCRYRAECIREHYHAGGAC